LGSRPGGIRGDLGNSLPVSARYGPTMAQQINEAVFPGRGSVSQADVVDFLATAAPSNDQIRGYHINRLYSPLANIRQMIYESQATTPAARQLFANAVLGETFVPPGGQLTLDILDRCRGDYRIEEVTR